jgi:hypothetical protein
LPPKQRMDRRPWRLFSCAFLLCIVMSCDLLFLSEEEGWPAGSRTNKSGRDKQLR